MSDPDSASPPEEGRAAETGGTDGSTPGDGDDWNPAEMEIETTFEGDGARGGAAEVVSQPGEFVTGEYWFEEESDVRTSPGTPFLWAMSAAGLYAASFIFAAVGLQFVAPPAADTYVDIVLSAVFFFPIPMAAYIAVGFGLEYYRARGEGRLPETAIPMALLVPVLLHVSLFFVEWIDTGYTDATLKDLFSQEPGLAQLLLWPPVIVGAIFAMIVYRTTVIDQDWDDDTEAEVA